MIFLDTNYFLRFLVGSEDAHTNAMTQLAALTFREIGSGRLSATTNEVVIHEVAYILSSATHYGQLAERIADQLSVILQLPGMRLTSGTKNRCLRALEIWSERPSLGFADALIVATLENTEVELATFDSHFNRIPQIVRWDPSLLGA